MGTPNQVNQLPEFPSHGDHDARLWAVGAFSGVVLGAYSKAMWTKSRMTDVVVIRNTEQQPVPQPQPTVAERIIAAKPLIVSQEVADIDAGGSQYPVPQATARITQQAPQPAVPAQRAPEPYWPGSAAARAVAEAYVPDRLSEADQQASLDATAELLSQVSQLRQEAGMPVHETVRAEAPVPVMAGAPALEVTPMQQVEQALPTDAPAAEMKYYKDVPVSELLEQIGYIHDEQGNN